MSPTRHAACRLLVADDPRSDESYATIVRMFGDVRIECVLRGDERAVFGYVAAWRTARSRLLDHLASECPDLELPPLTAEALDWEAVHAPFSEWMRSESPGSGLALDLVARLRTLLGHSAHPLIPAGRADDAMEGAVVSAEGAHRFYRHAVAALADEGSMAARIANAFGLNKAELGRLFGVSRQAAANWVQTDVPGDRRAKASVVLSTADLLSHRMKPGRLPGVARRPAAAYGGLSMLDMIAADRHEELLSSVRGSFDFAQTA